MRGPASHHRASLLFIAALSAFACSNVDRVTTTPTGPLVIQAERDTTLTSDTLAIGGKSWLRVAGADSTASIIWSVSDTAIAWVLHRLSNRVRLSAVHGVGATGTDRASE